MNDTRKQIIFISNPFGFGPTGKLYPIMQEMHKRLDCELIYFTGSLSSQIIKADYLKYVQVDERSEEDIFNKLKDFPNAVVISSLNRFAVKASKRLNIPCAFIDGLSWLWDSIPEDFLSADIYYALNFIGVDDKVKNYSQIKKVSYILDVEDLSQKEVREDFTLIHIGGFENPLYISFENNYLNLLIEFLQNIENQSKYIVVGGANAVQFVSERVDKKNFAFKTSGKAEFQKLLKTCKHLITTSGLTTTLEAFYAQTPVSFLLPSNLSQYKILYLLAQKKLTSSFTTWDDYSPTKETIWNLSEKDALPLLDNLAKDLINSDTKRECFLKNMNVIINTVPDTNAQYKFINELGVNGVSQIVDDLILKWNL